MKTVDYIKTKGLFIILSISVLLLFVPVEMSAQSREKSSRNRRDKQESVASEETFEVSSDTTYKEIITYDALRRDGKIDVKFYFEVDKYDFDPNFADNKLMLQRLDSVMLSRDLTFSLDSLVVQGRASIEGTERRNAVLAENRAKVVREVLLQRYKSLDSTKVFSRFIAEDWVGFRAKVVADDKVPYRDQVLKIIDDSRHSNGSKEWLLRQLRGGEPWRYLLEHILPESRYGASVVLYHNFDSLKRVSHEQVITYDTLPLPIPQVERIQKGFAVKTNLLYDAVTALNIEVEIPIGERFSVAGEWIFPWWNSRSVSTTSKRRYLQMLNGNLEAKYWLGDRADKRQLTGWFLGLYGGGGYYDFENKFKGYQGDFWHAGVSAGYAHTLDKKGNWRMEYSLGMGYLNSSYTYYEDHYGFPLEWHPLIQRYETLDWFGPTKAKISLVWFINYNKNKR